MSEHRSFSADGHAARWVTADGEHAVQLSLLWDNEAWTASIHLERERADVVLRLSPMWQVRQVMLFRDLDQPDLWLGTDGHGRWGEMNGAHRPDLDGAIDVALRGTGWGSPFDHTVPIRRLPLATGEAARLTTLVIDVETLGVVSVTRTYERVDERTWRVSGDGADGEEPAIEFDVDEFGIANDLGSEYRRIE